MRAIVQRISRGEVCIDDVVVGKADKGIMLLVGFNHEDLISDKGLDYIRDKVINLRIFQDEEGKMNLSLKDIQGDLLIVPNFTLYGDCRKGRRPSFILSAGADEARLLFDSFVEKVKKVYNRVETGIFQGDMAVEIVNDGPVTIILDSEKIV